MYLNESISRMMALTETRRRFKLPDDWIPQ
jgi:hypothetical protein